MSKRSIRRGVEFVFRLWAGDRSRYLPSERKQLKEAIDPLVAWMPRDVSAAVESLGRQRLLSACYIPQGEHPRSTEFSIKQSAWAFGLDARGEGPGVRVTGPEPLMTAWFRWEKHLLDGLGGVKPEPVAEGEPA